MNENLNQASESDAAIAAAPAAPVLVRLEGGLTTARIADERLWADIAERVRRLGGAGNGAGAEDGSGEDGGDGAGGLDPAALAYVPEALEAIRAARAEGRQVHLLDGGDPALAEAVADYLGLFDGVIAEDEAPDGHVLIGAEGRGAGAEAAAGHLVTVRADAARRARVAEAAHGHATHIGTAPDATRALLRALRPHQWLKNLLVLVPMLAAHQFDAATLVAAGLAFVSFSLVASSVYLLNDLLDLAADRAHPRKRKRPFASGDLPLATGRFLVPGMLGAGVLVGLFAGPAFLGVLALYYLATVLYSFNLKTRPIVDILTLAGLYTLRIFAGGAATGITLSVWLLAFSVFLFFALAAIKRQAELVDGIARGKAMLAGRGYIAEDVGLISQMAIAASYVAVLVMALYLNSEEMQLMYSWPGALWGICFVLLFWLSRAVMKTHRGEMHDDPIVFALKDRVSRICLAAMGILVLLAWFGGRLMG